jgi:hypothetical protein
LVVFLLIYALVGAAFAFNVRGVSDRAAAAYRGKTWLLRQIGRDNPRTWRAGGLVMVAFGTAMVVGMVVMEIWNPPPISTATAILVLGASAVVSVALLVWARRKAATDQPPEPPEGREWG